MIPRQLRLFEKAWQEQFEEWVHTAEGRKVADRFIKIAWGVLQRRQRTGAKEIWERLRWHYRFAKGAGEKYVLNNNYTAYMARFAMDREPRLKKFFRLREHREAKRPSRAVVIPIERAG